MSMDTAQEVTIQALVYEHERWTMIKVPPSQADNAPAGSTVQHAILFIETNQYITGTCHMWNVSLDMTGRIRAEENERYSSNSVLNKCQESHCCVSMFMYFVTVLKFIIIARRHKHAIQPEQLYICRCCG